VTLAATPAAPHRHSDNTTGSGTIPSPGPTRRYRSEWAKSVPRYCSISEEYPIAAQPIHLLREARGAGPRHAGSELGPFRVTCYLEPGREDVRLT